MMLPPFLDPTEGSGTAQHYYPGKTRQRLTSWQDGL
jgi:hypothetical protein